jgi:tetratricopeptide (TPR) repeat protein
MKSKSVKFKLIIFAILSAIVVGIVIDATLKNNKNDVVEISSKTELKTAITEEVKSSELRESEAKKQLQLNNKQEELEKKWKIGYDQFFAKKYQEAIQIERQVLKEDPSFYKAYAVEGIALAYSGDFEGGMKQIDKALELNPNYGYARFNKALANELYGHYDEAIKWYNKNLEIEKFEWSYYGIASVYGRKGDVNNVIKYLKLAIEINSSIKDAAKSEEDFDSVKQSKEFVKLIY